MKDSKISDASLNAIRQTCIRLLAMREHSQTELFQKLQQRGYVNEEISLILQEMSLNGWQDNQRYAESFARQRINKGYGPLKIKFELRGKGVEEFDLDHFAEEMVGGWQACLLSLYRNKFDHETNLTRHEWLKRCRYLQQRGFSPDLIRQLSTQLKLQLRS